MTKVKFTHAPVTPEQRDAEALKRANALKSDLTLAERAIRSDGIGITTKEIIQLTQ